MSAPLTEKQQSDLAGELEGVLRKHGLIASATVPAFLHLEECEIRIHTHPTPRAFPPLDTSEGKPRHVKQHYRRSEGKEAQ